MKKDNINELFKQLENDFDIAEPRYGHEQRFLTKLNQEKETPRVSKSYFGNLFWKPALAVAATLVLCFSLLTVFQNNDPELLDLANVSPEMSETQSFFMATINKEIAALESERSPETAELIDDAMKELKILEEVYQNLKVQLTESGNDKRVIYAMINNFQNRIDVLNTVLEHIEEVKTFKNNQNENTTTI